MLVTVPRPEHLIENTLAFDTIRTGFPNCPIEIWDNCNDDETKRVILDGCEKTGALYTASVHKWHHADWIEMIVKNNDGEIIIVDPDTIWYENCQELDFPTLLAGRFVPVIWNEFAGAISYERLHTSFLQIKDCQELRDRIVLTYPNIIHNTADYSPLNPFRPVVTFYGGYPMFWDTCSVLFQMIGGTCFTENELRRYSHVNSSAFQDVMEERVRDRKGFILQHEKARKKDYEWFKDYWKAEEKYYAEMNQKAHWMMEQRQKKRK